MTNKIFKTRAYPRAALIGNPSDGYHGKTIAFTFTNFQTDVTIYPSRRLEILPSDRDRRIYNDMDDLVSDVSAYGYYGGIRLIKAAISRFLRYCRAGGREWDGGNFTIRYHSSIPPHLGLAGSSAIITAVMRALMAYSDVEIDPAILADIVWRTEFEELDIGGGLQDRVAQAYEGIVYMDFSRDYMEKNGIGRYEVLDPPSLPRLYIAYHDSAAESSETVHNNLRYRYDSGEQSVVAAMSRFGELSERMREMMITGQYDDVDDLMNANFDLRASICAISPRHRLMVETARNAGASAKFTGSGGAVIGTYPDENILDRLRAAFKSIGASLIIPDISGRPAAG